MTLSVQSLTKKIGHKDIIKGINLELKKGEVFGFLGPNGAGKTTTIRMLVGLIKPTSGTIVINGYPLHTHFTEAIEKLGCIVENPELYPYLSGLENLQQFARMLPEFSPMRLDEIIKLVGLEHRIHDLVKTYSLGMRQRLGIAQALLNDPNILILDEPTNGLDPSGIREMREFIRKLAKEKGMSVLVSSHLLSEIQLMCDRVAIIVRGSIIKTDEVVHLLTDQARIVWRCQPIEAAYQLLSKWTHATLGEEGDCVITADIPEERPRWHKALVEAMIDVYEVKRELPTLEELFLDLTGGESIE